MTSTPPTTTLIGFLYGTSGYRFVAVALSAFA